jgi:hypothetical protein
MNVNWICVGSVRGPFEHCNEFMSTDGGGGDTLNI